MPGIITNPPKALDPYYKDQLNAFDHMDNSVKGMEFSEKVLLGEGKKITPPDYEILQKNKERMDAAKNDMGSLTAMDWMKITLKQLQCQVPGEDTMKSSEVAQQFTQMGMLTGMNKVAENITEMKKGLDGLVEMKASNSIGKMVEVESGTFRIKNKQIPSFGFELPVDVDKVNIAIYDPNNRLIHSRTLEENLTPGKHLVEWQGETQDKKPIQDGYYRFTVQAVDQDGKALRSRRDGSMIKPSTFMLGRLEDVNRESKEIVVNGVSLPRTAWKATVGDKHNDQTTTSQMNNKPSNPMEGFTDELKQEIDNFNAAKALKAQEEAELEEIRQSIL